MMMMKSIRLNAVKCQADEISVEHYIQHRHTSQSSWNEIYFNYISLEVEFQRVPAIVFVYDFFKVNPVAFVIASVV